MKVILAEKPSVARDLAAVVGASRRRDGFLEGNGYQVTWAFGHLVTLKEPDDYDASLKRWSLDTLPIVPEPFELKLTGDDGARKQYHIVEELFRAADELICATDAGREGELIFRYILEMSGCTAKPMRRLWLSALTDEAIRTALANTKPGHDYDNLYAAARCRSEADWIVGMNATRNFTVRYGKSGVLWSVGRVQTPVLALIVRRDDEIRHFVPRPWFEVRTRYRDVLFKLQADRFDTQHEAKALTDGLGPTFEVKKVQTKRERERPPQLYDLTALQRDMNVRFGASAADTLKEVQSLYESKLVTYPRTDSRYLPLAMRDEVDGVLRRLGEAFDAVAALDLETTPLAKRPLDKRIFDDKKVADHHALLPTGRRPGQLGKAASRVYDAIVMRTIAAFYPACEKDITTVDGRVAGATGPVAFRARGVRITKPGWRALRPEKKPQEGNAKAEGDEDKQELPEFTVGESGPHVPDIKEGETRPPRHYNENSLLAAMETAGSLVDDEELKEVLKARGLGTPATRANIIETLLHRRYISREKKTLLATDLGRYLIAVIQNPILTSAEMTGGWEAQLRDIEAGTLDPKTFRAGIEAFTRDVIAASDHGRLDDATIGACPACGSEVIEGQRGYGCSKWNEGCEWVLWKVYHDHTIKERQARELLQRKISIRPARIEGTPMTLAMTANGEVTHFAIPQREHQRGNSPRGARRGAATSPKRTSPSRTFSKTAPKTASPKPAGTDRPPAARASAKKAAAKKPPAPTLCPLCQRNMVEREASFSCAGWRAGCTFSINKVIAGKKISRAMARKLLTKGQTQVLKGFTSKSNKPFDARLRLEDGRIRFDLSGD